MMGAKFYTAITSDVVDEHVMTRESVSVLTVCSLVTTKQFTSSVCSAI